MNTLSRVLLIVSALPSAAAAQALLTERTLGLTAANEAAMTALEQCRKEGHRVAVTVLDHAGRTKVMVRDDGANPHTVQHSLNKAYTALTFRTSSGEYGKRAVAGSAGTPRGPPGGATDEKCAQAGIERIDKQLKGP